MYYELNGLSLVSTFQTPVNHVQSVGLGQTPFFFNTLVGPLQGWNGWQAQQAQQAQSFGDPGKMVNMDSGRQGVGRLNSTKNWSCIKNGSMLIEAGFFCAMVKS